MADTLFLSYVIVSYVVLAGMFRARMMRRKGTPIAYSDWGADTTILTIIWVFSPITLPIVLLRDIIFSGTRPED